MNMANFRIMIIASAESPAKSEANGGIVFRMVCRHRPHLARIARISKIHQPSGPSAGSVPAATIARERGR
jgi:hypothetical protein